MHTVLATLDGPPLLLAQPETGTSEGTTAEGDPNGEDSNATPSGGPDFITMMLVIGAVLLCFMMLAGGGNKKARKRQQELLANMSKGDKVVSIGGIKGSVVEVRDTEVVVKVDENNNTRMKFTKEAIREVVKDKDKDKDES
ncbi:MAG: preprotein translocase subunit YajC [Planctomycetota bacterium]